MKPLFRPERTWTARPCAWWIVVFVMLAGCDRNEIKVYRVAKEQAPLQPAPAAMPESLPAGHPDMDASASPQAPLTWTRPDGWDQQPPGEMRVASFRVKGSGNQQADVSIVPLGGSAGGDAANVNRWRGQVGLAALSEEEVKKLAQTVEVDGQPAALYDLAGQQAASGDAARILGAIQYRDGTAWFFKMTGGDEIVVKQKPTFVAFLKSVHFQTAENAALPPSHPPLGGGNLPTGHPDISSAASVSTPTATGSPGEGQPNWQVPAGWQAMSAGQFLVAKFSITGEAGTAAAVNVSRSAGDGGGLAANINRWRNQLGLGPVDENELAKLSTPVELETPGSIAIGKGMFVDMSGTDGRTGQPVRLIGAMVPLANETWFYKLMGDEKIVAREKAAFTRFVQTVKY